MSQQSAPRALGGPLRGLLTTKGAWVLLAVMVAGTLAYGSVHQHSGGRAARVAYLESVLKCPPCADVSIAQSEDPEAQALRTSVTSWVKKGWSDTRIENTVVAEFGTNELLAPRSAGIDALVWILPSIAIIAGGLGIASVLFRRRQRDLEASAAHDAALVSEARAKLSQQ